MIQELIKANKNNEDLGQQCKAYQQEIERMEKNGNKLEELGKLVEERNQLVGKINSLEVENMSIKRKF